MGGNEIDKEEKSYRKYKVYKRLGRPRHKWLNFIYVKLRRAGYKPLGWIPLAQIKIMVGYRENDSEI